MATLKQIRARIRTSKNIRQITRAMKLVAAARLKRAQDRVTEARPYSEKMRELMLSLSEAGGLPDHPLLTKAPEVKRICLIVVSADRGLKGSYNTNIIRKSWDWLKEQSAETTVYCVGKKGFQFLGKRGYNMIGMHNVPTSGATVVDGKLVTEFAREQFESGTCDAVYICYSKFYSPIKQIPQIVQVLPIEPPQSEEGPKTGVSKEYEFEPDPKSLLEQLLPKYLLNQVFQALLESTASEFGAQMTAMTSATDNAGKMINDLTLKANRERQATITKEILEIVGGAEALKS